MSTASNRRWAGYESPFGKLVLTANPRGLDGLFFPGRGAGQRIGRLDRIRAAGAGSTIEFRTGQLALL